MILLIAEASLSNALSLNGVLAQVCTILRRERIRIRNRAGGVFRDRPKRELRAPVEHQESSWSPKGCGSQKSCVWVGESVTAGAP